MDPLYQLNHNYIMCKHLIYTNFIYLAQFQDHAL